MGQPDVLVFIIVSVVFWVLCGVVASSVGPERYSGRLFVLSALFMGPLGIATALIMRTLTDLEEPDTVQTAERALSPKLSSARSHDATSYRCECGAVQPGTPGTTIECRGCGEPLEIPT
jgi:hypothetical protein